MQSAQVFISYSRNDEAFVRWLAGNLENNGVNVWMDVQDLDAGIKWSTAIQDALKTCKVMVVVVSPDSMKSKNVEDEWQFFLDQKKPLVPLLYREAELHFQLSRVQYISFLDQDQRQAFTQLYRHLQTLGVARRGVDPRALVISKQPEFIRRHQLHEPGKYRWVWRGGIIGSVLLLVVAFVALAVYLLFPPGTDAAPGPLRTLVPGDDPRLEVVEGENTILRREGQDMGVYENMPLQDADYLNTRDSRVRTVFQMGAFAVTQKDTLVDLIAVTDTFQPLVVELTDGEIYLERGNWGNVAMVRAVNVDYIAQGSSIRVDYDLDSGDLIASCFIGTCQVEDTSVGGISFPIPAGTQAVVNLERGDLKDAIFEPIPQEDYEGYAYLCGGDCTPGVVSAAELTLSPSTPDGTPSTARITPTFTPPPVTPTPTPPTATPATGDGTESQRLLTPTLTFTPYQFAANSDPIVQPVAPLVMQAGQSQTLAVMMSDPDPGDTPYVSNVSPRNQNIVTASTWQGVISLQAWNAGTTTVDLWVSDGRGGQTQASFAVTVTGTPARVATATFTPPYTPSYTPTLWNSNPWVGGIDDQMLLVGQQRNLPVSGYDADGDPLNYLATSSNASVASVYASEGAISLTAVGAGTATVTVTVTDGRGGSDETSFLVTVQAPAANNPPVISPISSQWLWTNDLLTVPILASDPDGDPLVFTVVSGNVALVSASISIAEVVLTSQDNSGTTTISVTASDGNGGLAEVSFVVTVRRPMYLY
ncbi:MAG: TIR domain-containing protein [Chloroflexi bacterium]|nr:TIR domain-containing protein [Chloroflexota bacterium]